MLIDTHCHLDFSQFDIDRDSVIKRAVNNKISYLINVGSSITSSLRSKDLADKFENIFFSVGFHPHYADEFSTEAMIKLDDLIHSSSQTPPFKVGLKGQLSINPEQTPAFKLGKANGLIKNKKLVAIGEVGLDYFKSSSSKDKQKKVFLEFIGLAKKLDLPLVIHCRESHSDTYGILKDEFSDFKKIVFHCFSGPKDFLVRCLNLGAMFSFTANITYPAATKLRELAGEIPLDKIMLETDSPYLAAQKFRGQRNEPSYIHFVAQELASIKNTTFEEIAAVTTKNAERFFKLDEYKSSLSKM